MITIPPAKHSCRNLDDCNRRLELMGFKPSAACWEDANQIYVCSIESFGPATYGHPQCEIILRRQSGVLQIYGLQSPL